MKTRILIPLALAAVAYGALVTGGAHWLRSALQVIGVIVAIAGPNWVLHRRWRSLGKMPSVWAVPNPWRALRTQDWALALGCSTGGIIVLVAATVLFRGVA
jgi:hypothetical protein